MAFLFMGAEMDAFAGNSGSAVEVTTATHFNSAYARCACRTGNQNITQYIETPVFATATTCWVHWDSYCGAATSNAATLASFFNSSGTEVFRLFASSSAVIQAQYWNGSAWTNVGSTFNLSSYAGSLITYDLKFIGGASGSFELWGGPYLGAQTLILSGSATMTAAANFARGRFWCHNINNTLEQFVSQVIIADEDTRGMKLHSKPPTGNSGTNIAFTGAFGDVDETVLSQTDYINSAVANDVETFTGAAITLTGRTVKAVAVSMQAKQDGSAPTQVQAALRIGSTNYFSTNLSPTTTYAPLIAIWAQDPSTAAAWGTTNAGAATTEFGAKSIT